MTTQVPSPQVDGGGPETIPQVFFFDGSSWAASWGQDDVFLRGGPVLLVPANITHDEAERAERVPPSIGIGWLHGLGAFLRRVVHGAPPLEADGGEDHAPAPGRELPTPVHASGEVSALREALLNHEATIARLTEENNTFAAQEVRLVNQRRALKRKVRALRQQLKTKTTDREPVELRVTQLQEQLARERKATAQGRVARLEAETQARQVLDELDAARHEAARVYDLERSLKEANERIHQLEQLLKTTQERIAELPAQDGPEHTVPTEGPVASRGDPAPGVDEMLEGFMRFVNSD